ncbi:nicotinamide riboside transporter PnuC [Teredinibacter sp. KSP-S5-2]|uniref:nicotinamide riboside transporter PnuC n=1 Tax=Teredinibacter sp. KSP-S5-2 TaxID=3034506 RepID=UPI0029342ADC|nr:nicotinamide riboside transporter PnuC [Teredinibacter sp. KSP-S5-2]WNO10171.1 nicotinamide riboside transporter PnuC [Teredinibacter sp. KSP-S5-2]
MTASDIFQQVYTAFIQQSGPEIVAVMLSIAYLVLVMKENMWCWPAAFLSTAIFTWLFFSVNLLMESVLNVYYMVMAVYGWWAWKNADDDPDKITSHKPILKWHKKKHTLVILSVIVASAINGYFLSKHTNAAWPYLDSFTTWGAVITTYMVARKVFENWYYWLVIDGVALFLYIERGLYYIALLDMIYLVLVVIGIVQWKKKLANQSTQADQQDIENINAATETS